ncbi:MAG TPA: ATP-binding protein [Xanthobacteraceae bacterium]|jgi:hypothetical protein
MRDLGYSLETAVADIVDNSISANATAVDVVCDLTAKTPTLVIVDNGSGMSSEGILAAMRHGGTDPRRVRSSRDLGRFGLGLKTASFSQCRTLTVVTSQNGQRCGTEWDLDVIDKEDDWILSILEEQDMAGVPFVDRLGANGTIVVWRNLDRLFEDERSSKRDEIVNEKLDILEKHLSLVFHRFLAGEIKGQRKLTITVNGHPVEPFDPFCRKSGSEMLPEEIVRIGDEAVHMQTYILPHHTRLSAKDYEYYQSRSDFISNQGAYVYRNGRLMAWGEWFRLIPKGESTKLARVQIDFPSSLDEMWTIDIKKSRARPPHAVRERLRQIIPRISGRSTTVHRGRGQKLFEEIRAPVWERYADQGTVRYVLNSHHPLAEAVIRRLDEAGEKSFRLLLEVFAAALPVEMIYSDYSTNPRGVAQVAVESEVTERLLALKNALFAEGPVDSHVLREVIRSIRLFENHDGVVEQFIGGDSDGGQRTGE